MTASPHDLYGMRRAALKRVRKVERAYEEVLKTDAGPSKALQLAHKQAWDAYAEALRRYWSPRPEHDERKVLRQAARRKRRAARKQQRREAQQQQFDKFWEEFQSKISPPTDEPES